MKYYNVNLNGSPIHFHKHYKDAVGYAGFLKINYPDDKIEVVEINNFIDERIIKNKFKNKFLEITKDGETQRFYNLKLVADGSSGSWLFTGTRYNIPSKVLSISDDCLIHLLWERGPYKEFQITYELKCV